MSLPIETKRKIKLRNAKIVVSWSRGRATIKELSEKYKLTERRIEQIVYTNHDFVKFNTDWEKKKRLNILNRLIEGKKEYSNKDVVELLEAQRKELEGDGSMGKPDTKVIIIRESNGNKDQRGAVSGSVSIVRV